MAERFAGAGAPVFSPRDHAMGNRPRAGRLLELTRWSLPAFLVASALGCSLPQDDAPSGREPAHVAFVGVNVVPMDREVVLVNQTALALRPSSIEHLEDYNFALMVDDAPGMDLADEFGAVKVGYIADLILLDGNPLEDIAHTTHRAGVMVRGQWFPEAELQQMLEDVAASHEESRSSG